MKKNFFVFLFLIFSAFALNACNSGADGDSENFLNDTRVIDTSVNETNADIPPPEDIPEASFGLGEIPADWARGIGPEMDLTRNVPFWGDERARILEEIGGLAFNEAYQFRHDDGLYYVISGWRHLADAEELSRYKNWGVPQEIGGFRLLGIVINDGLHDDVRVFREPMHPPFAWSMGFFEEPAPVGEIFTDWQVGFAFLALYENDAGDYAAFSVYAAWFSPAEYWPVNQEIIFSESDEFPEILFRGNGDEYLFALYDSIYVGGLDAWVIAELHFRENRDLPDRVFGYWAHESNNFAGIRPVPREKLEELTRLFDPAELFARYRWQMDSWQ